MRDRTRAAYTPHGAEVKKIMATRPIYDLIDTWNGVGDYDGIKMVITNTASGSGSNILDLGITSGASIVVAKTGVMTLSNGSVSLALSPVLEATRTTLGIPYTNVRNYGATGDGATDDYAAIAAAIAAAPLGGTLFFPAGHYKVSAQLETGYLSMLGEGMRESAACTIIEGTGAAHDLIVPGAYSKACFARMRLQSTRHVFNFSNNQSSVSLRDLHMYAGEDGWCVRSDGNVFSLTLDNIICGSDGSYETNGLYLTSHTIARNLEINGLKEGIRVTGVNTVIEGARMEVNLVAIKIGVDIDGATAAASRPDIKNVTFESNRTAVDVVAATDMTLKDLSITGFEEHAPSVDGPIPSYGGDPEHGLILRSVARSHIENVSTSLFVAGHSTIEVGDVYRTQFKTVNADNYAEDGSGWSSAAALFTHSASNSFHDCNVPWLATTNGLAVGSLNTHALAAVNHLSPPLQGRNLRGIDVPVTEGATTKAVVFSNKMSGGDCDIYTLTGSNAGGSLVAGTTYYYLPCGVTETGEARGAGEESVTLTAGQNRVAVALYGTSGRIFKIRLYRGTVSGVYDGYYEFPLNDTSYTDTGAAFTVTGIDPPGTNHVDNDCREPDANFAVLVTPNWLTTWKVTGKATTGFTVTFGTAAPASATFDYMIVR